LFPGTRGHISKATVGQSYCDCK